MHLWGNKKPSLSRGRGAASDKWLRMVPHNPQLAGVCHLCFRRASGGYAAYLEFQLSDGGSHKTIDCGRCDNPAFNCFLYARTLDINGV